MVDVAVANSIGKYNVWSAQPNLFHDQSLMGLINTEKAITHTEVVPVMNAKDGRSPSCLFLAEGYTTTRAQLALRQIYDTDFFSCLDVPEYRPRATQLHIIWMGRKGQDI